MYLKHFNLERFPFHLTPDTQLFLGLAPHFEAIQVLSAAITMGEGVTKLTGEVGTGKTMVCRMLLTHLGADVALIYLPNPMLDAIALQQAVAAELQLELSPNAQMVEQIQTRLIELHQQGKRIVALVDEAQALSDEALETLRLFGNLETEQAKLLQIILIGQPELDTRLAQHHLRQFRQRITFNVQLRPLTQAETIIYIESRLTKAQAPCSLFSVALKKAVWHASQGIPRLINQICHKALLLAWYELSPRVKRHHLLAAIDDTYDSCKPRFKTPVLWGWSQP
ncbi:MAG: ExeA family protein [Vibrio sp.]|uniref:AAA family ATPase n=1 Tax=Vibrio chanodichtyis TaxID=3027932 RepID=A0ABT5V2C4_9VIBR|nr:AAA family ATPase [Vibrio chanodichtyis]MDE1515811.1 AAA family ATPase [Vibrio chanodichtyis]